MLIDCARCAMRDIACDDCVVGVLVGDVAAAGHMPELDEVEHEALGRLAAVGLVPVLRHRRSA